jgi:SNF family Na+-dependent transporter
MANFDTPKRDGFSSKFGVIAAAAGSAVGLGNIWRFPYVAGENGGGAFMILYLGFILFIGIPVMLSEFTIGRSAQKNAFGSFKTLAPISKWWLIGLMGIIAAFVILAFYSTVAGWTLEYIIQAVGNSFSDKSYAELNAGFGEFVSGSFRPVLWQVIFMILTAGVVYAGIQKGIEKYTKILMPILLLLIIVVCIRSLTLDGASGGMAFLFSPDFSQIDLKVVLMALGQAAFSLSIGMGALITYGSYIKKDNNLVKTSFQVAGADTLIAILAGVMIFPALFALGLMGGEEPIPDNHKDNANYTVFAKNENNEKSDSSFYVTIERQIPESPKDSSGSISLTVVSQNDYQIIWDKQKNDTTDNLNSIPRGIYPVSIISKKDTINTDIVLNDPEVKVNGPGLVFTTLPLVFQEMPGGYVFGIVFFMLLAVAALTSTISVLEVVVAYLKEELKLKRSTATISAAAAITVIGVFATLSFGPLADVKLFDKTIFDLFDFVSANILLTFGALFIVIFFGWKYGSKRITQEVTNENTLKVGILKVFIFIIKYVAPIAIGAVAIGSLLLGGLT